MFASAPESSRVAATLKGEARRQRLLETAANAFLEFGYADVSMQVIVRLAGGSASTAYQLFGNKEGLLIAVLERELEQLRQQAFPATVFELPVVEALEVIAQRMVAHAVQQRSVRFYRLVMAECHRLEKMQDYLCQQMALQIYAPLERCLRIACARGELQIDDPEQAARTLGNLITGISQEARIEGGYADGPLERDRVSCSYSIRMFLRAFRSR